MDPKKLNRGLGTLVNHYGEGHNPLGSHITPIFMSSTYSFPDVDTVKAVYEGNVPGFIYGRYGNPNTRQTAQKIAMLA